MIIRKKKLSEKEIIKKEVENLKIQAKNKEKKDKHKTNYSWLAKIIVFTLILSFTFSFISETTLPKVNLVFEILIVFLFIGIGILFDIIGVGVTSASEEPFHSMASRKVKGAKTAVIFKKNADKVSSFCCDVIGDICGVISGSAGVIIASSLASTFSVNPFLMSLSVTAIIAALTIGGKAMGKSFAINKSDIILYEFSKVIAKFKSEK